MTYGDVHKVVKVIKFHSYDIQLTMEKTPALLIH